MSITKSNFFLRLDKLRRDRHEKIVDIARLCGISPPAVQGWKHGKMPTYDKLRLLSEHYNVTSDWLLTGREGVSHMRETATSTYGGHPTAPPQVHDMGNLDLPLPSQWADCPVCRAKDKEIAYLQATLKSAIARLPTPRDNEPVSNSTPKGDHHEHTG